MSKTIYIVTEGSYSDYHIEQIFSKKEDAELFVKLENGKSCYNDYRVEEFEIDNVKLPNPKDVIHYFHCTAKVYHSKSLAKYYIIEKEIFKRECLQIRTKPSGFEILKYKQCYCYPNIYGDTELATIKTFSQKSMEHACKILVEQFQIFSQQAFEDGKL